VREGEKNREVTVVFKAPEPPPSPPPPPPAFERPVPVAVWVLGGLTVVGGALFATFGALGVSERGSTCAPQGCTESQRDSIETKFRIGDISLAVGAAALVTGTVLFFTRAQVEKPAPLSARALADLRDAVTRSPRAYLGVAPNKGGGALVVGARF
jgi:hypothetical protein